MRTEVGEYVVGAWLKLGLDCDVVDYNVRPPGGGLNGLGELDVVGYNLAEGRAYLCEVTTHVGGLLIGSRQKTVATIAAKHERQKSYAEKYLSGRFPHLTYMFWSPCVPKGYLTEQLSRIQGLELIINGRYKACVDELRRRARKEKHDAVNPFFRMLQITECLRDD